MKIPFCWLIAAGLGVLAAAQTPPAPAPAAPLPLKDLLVAAPWLLSPDDRQRLQKLSAEDHADMMRQLGITRMRPGRNPSAGSTNPPNTDEARANPWPDWPELLVTKAGKPVTTSEEWWRVRRPEILEDYEREVIGRIPEGVPPVTWTVTRRLETQVGGHPVVAQQVIGHADNAACPAIAVDLKLAGSTTADVQGPVPVLVMFGSGAMPDEPVPRFPGMYEPKAPPVSDQLIAAGWGYVSLSATSVQPDNFAGLTSGIIGLTNRGARRTPEQWGVLRAWGWGASRTIDYLATRPEVDARKIGIEGVSRFGKAAMVTMAVEPRFAVALVSSSGLAGAKPYRRDFGQIVENLTNSYEGHWMAGNFLKYGAAESRFGAKTANDLPVDAHEVIALCAPRPVLIGCGLVANGDAHWIDHQGSFMAAVAAGPAYRLLGARDLGVTEDYRTAVMPPPNTGLLDGQLAWRQHDGGHEDRTNMGAFLVWANRELKYTPRRAPAAGN